MCTRTPIRTTSYLGAPMCGGSLADASIHIGTPIRAPIQPSPRNKQPPLQLRELHMQTACKRHQAARNLCNEKEIEPSPKQR